MRLLIASFNYNQFSERQTVFINIGRGSIISEECLLNALNNNWIYGAILDVFETEPLNSQSALWSQPNVIFAIII